MTGFTDKFWDTTYRKQIGKLIGICYRYVSDHQVAEDLAHDTFITAIDKSKSFKGTGSFEGWLRKIAVNNALHYLRDKKQEKSFDDITINQNNIMETANEDTELKRHDTFNFSEAELLDIVNSLPEHHRLVFNLYVIDKFSHNQISEKLGISPGTSRSHLARARKKLHEQLLEKPTSKANKQKKKRALLLFILTFRLKQIDRLYQKGFQNFEIQPSDIDYLKSINLEHAAVPIFKPLVFSLKYILLSVVSVVGILTLVLVIRNDDSETTQHPKIKADSAKKSDTISTKEIRHIESEICSEIGDINRTDNTMSNDSLAHSVNGNTKQIDFNKDNNDAAEKINMTETSDFIEDKLTVKQEGKTPNKQKISGTFFASRLIWSEEDNAIYVQGRIKIDYNGREANLVYGKTLLDKNVHLLSINNKLVELGSKIKIGKDCNIIKLGKEEAMKKYGKKGRFGAVEISVIEL